MANIIDGTRTSCPEWLTGTGKRKATISLAVAVIGLLLAADAAPGKARLAKEVVVTAKTTATATFGKQAAGGDYAGRIRFPKVKPVFRRDAVPKKMARAARHACYRLYAGGTNKYGTPYVRLVQRPMTYGGLRLNDASDTRFMRAGRWKTWGAGGSDHEPYKGRRIEVQGGIWDQYRNERRNFVPSKFRFQGKQRTAQCHAFTTVIDPT